MTLRIEHIVVWWLHLVVIEFELFNNFGFLALVVVLSTTACIVILTIVEQVVLSLAITVTAHVSLFLVSARQAILVQNSSKVRLLARFELLCICHDYLDSLEILSASTYSLHKLQILTLHVLVTLGHFVVLESEFKHFLTGDSFSLSRLLPIALIHVQSGFHLCSSGRDTTVVFMN